MMTIMNLVTEEEAAEEAEEEVEEDMMIMKIGEISIPDSNRPEEAEDTTEITIEMIMRTM